MSTHTRRRFVQSALGSGVALLAAPGILRHARAAQPVIAASLLGADKPETAIWEAIRDLTEARLPGRFAFRIVQNAALGGEKEVTEGMQLGSIQASLATMAALSAYVPETQLFDLPFVFRDAAHVQAAAEGAPGEALAQKLLARNFVVAGYVNYGARHLLAKEELTRPEDMKGKRMRVIQSPLHAALWSAFGALPTAMPITETYNALSTGMVDTMDLTKSAYAGFKLYEVAPCVIETGHIWASGAALFSASFWAGLDAEAQTVLAESAREGCALFNRLIVQDEKASEDSASAHGARFMPIDDRAEWQSRARGVWASMAGDVGGLEAISAIAALAP